jgi:hypothetical protein
MTFSVTCALALLLCCSSVARAAPETYAVNLGPVARTNINRLTAVGRGTAGAVLDGNRLTFNGQFSGLVSPATDTHLCVSSGIGIPGTCGPALDVTKAASGTLSGTLTLNARQMTALPAGQLYVQINSVQAPAPGGNLWGWLLPAHDDVEDDVPQQGHWFLPQYDMPKSVEHGSTHEIAEPRS